MNIRKIVKWLIPRSLFRKIEPFGHWCEAVLFNILYGFPARGLKVIGITGTNGKTTTAYLIHKMLQESGYKVGLMTTVAWGVGDNIRPQIAHMTTVSVPVLLRRIKQMKAEGMEWLVLETTSHALAQNRVWGVPFKIAVVTNLTHEHLDYHGSFDRYKAAKRRLFNITNRNKSGLQVGVINADDPELQDFSSAIKNPITYGINSGDIRVQQLKTTPSGSTYKAVAGNDNYNIECHLPGRFNVYNSLAALAVGRAVGLSQVEIERGIAALDRVEGRMESIDEGQDFDVIVDFAHTPDSFEKIFQDLRPAVQGKLIVMFGSAGRRDQAKRAIQGRLAGEYCDEVIITEEDDRDEDGQMIMDQIADGAQMAGKIKGKDLFLKHDRTQAIKFAISRARPGDLVLLLGKGHEKTMERSSGEEPWDEIGIARQALAERLDNI